MCLKSLSNPRLYIYNQSLSKYDNIDKEFLVNSLTITKLDHICTTSFEKTFETKFFNNVLILESSITSKTFYKKTSSIPSNFFVTLRSKILYTYFEFLLYTNYTFSSTVLKKLHFDRFFIKLFNSYSFFHSKTLLNIKSNFIKVGSVNIFFYYKNLNKLLPIIYCFIPVRKGE